MSKLESKQEVKASMNSLIHMAIHELHDESEKLLDLTPENDRECLTKLLALANDVSVYLRMRHALDIE